MRHGSVPAETPVFVDHSGTRRRWFAVLGVAGAGLLAIAVVLLVAGFLGGGPDRLPGLPGLAGTGAPQAAAERMPTPSPAVSGRVPRPGASAPATAPHPGPTAAPSSPTPTPASSPTRHGNPPPHPSHTRSSP